MTRRKKWLAVFAVLSLVAGCAEAATNPLAPPESGSTVALCNSELTPCDSPVDPLAPDPGIVQENPCAGCTGAPNIESTRVVVEIDAAGTITGYSEMQAWGNAYTITMSVGGSIPGGQSWTSPTVSNSYSSGLFTIGGLSTRMSARSPVAILATGQKCGLTATGYATFRAEIKALGSGNAWRSHSKSDQARPVLQKACTDETPPKEVDVPSPGAGGDRDPTILSESPPCWDHYLIISGTWYYQYTACY
ncbi:MAG: hypothetical protein LH467_06280 [Gemmatimonadaceae bacterium]|nr:hypothetical protein [Gemmatimonadaceae bacterium]